MFRKIRIIVLFWIFVAGVCNVVKRSPSCVGGVCEFDWVVDYKFTMMWYNKSSDHGPQYQPIGLVNNRHVKRRSTTPNCTETLNGFSLTDFLELVSTGDGEYRLVYAINGQIPGPEVVVTEGDMVAIRVHNRLQTEGVTFHWHGLLQRGTPWMDGVAMVSQCPILPGQVFQYRFIAEPVGTHWYHAHSGAMRSDGLSGAFIVLPKQPAVPRNIHDGEFFAVVQDWTKRSASETTQAYRSRIFGLDDYGGACRPAEYTPDGAESILPLNVGIVNGRGRRHTANGQTEKPFIPLETFTVKAKKSYRFRIINAGFALPFQISIEEHLLYVVALDGNDVEEQKCDAVVVSPGESADIRVFTDQPADNYNIHFKTLSVQTPQFSLKGKYMFNPKTTRAILNYEGVFRYKPPASSQKTCSTQDPCYIVNSIYGTPPYSMKRIHINLMNIRSTEQTLKQFPVPTESHESRRDVFLHFHNTHGRPAINGRHFVYPSSALQTYPKDPGIIPCKAPHCTTQSCTCTHTIKLEMNNIFQLVLFSRGSKESYPVHFHGHRFHVVKIGYPSYDPITGIAYALNPDIKCLNDDCSNATWADPSWLHGIPSIGMNLKDPPIKDTVTVPWGGYVVIRIFTDNPGYWLLHSQLGHHQSQGMSLVIQEGDSSNMALTPLNFPTCGSFESSKEDIEKAIFDQKDLIASERVMQCGRKSSNPIHSAMCRTKNEAEKEGSSRQQGTVDLNNDLIRPPNDLTVSQDNHLSSSIGLVDAILESGDFPSGSHSADDKDSDENDSFKEMSQGSKVAHAHDSTTDFVTKSHQEVSIEQQTPSNLNAQPSSSSAKSLDELFKSFLENPGRFIK